VSKNISNQNKNIAILLCAGSSERIKNFDKQTLLNIEGVGVISSKKILDKYKTIEKLSKATYEDLEEIVSPNIARKIFTHFNGL